MSEPLSLEIHIISLPQEILVLILNKLDYRSLLLCSSVCKHLRTTIQTSAELTYIIELAQDGMVDNVSTPSVMTHSDRLALLRARRNGWRTSSCNTPLVVKLAGQCRVYDFVGGVFVEPQGKYQFHALWLPSTNMQGRGLFRGDLGIDARDFVMDPSQDLIIFLALEEHGLATNISPNQKQWSLHIRSLDTHEPYGGARLPFFKIPNQAEDPSNVRRARLDLAGDVVGIHLTTEYVDRVIIWNWVEGIMITALTLEGQALADPRFFDFSFISPRAFIFSSPSGTGAVHIFTFSSREHCPPTHVASLLLPDLQPNVSLIGISSHGSHHENPGSAPLGDEREPFLPHPEKRVHVLRVGYLNLQAAQTTMAFIFVLRNSTFLRFVEEYEKGASGLVTLKWPMWGPQATRVLPGLLGDTSVRYMYGQRVILPLSREPSVRTVQILDFNIHPEQTRHSSSSHGTSSGEPQVYMEPSILPRNDAFKDDVESRLPYTLVSRDFPQKYSTYLMDGVRIIGIKRDDGTSVELHVYGV